MSINTKSLYLTYFNNKGTFFLTNIIKYQFKTSNNPICFKSSKVSR